MGINHLGMLFTVSIQLVGRCIDPGRLSSVSKTPLLVLSRLVLQRRERDPISLSIEFIEWVIGRLMLSPKSSTNSFSRPGVVAEDSDPFPMQSCGYWCHHRGKYLSVGP